eukprot:7755491-Lingulodinium_polyedra.AAC.1
MHGRSSCGNVMVEHRAELMAGATDERRQRSRAGLRVLVEGHCNEATRAECHVEASSTPI